MPEHPEPPMTVAQFATPSRARLAAAVRDLVDATLTEEDVDDAVLDRAADLVHEVVRLLGNTEDDASHRGVRHRVERDPADYQHRSVVIGPTNPLAPPMAAEYDGERLVARGAFGAPYEGPPGVVHGGWLALAFDEFLGMLNVFRGDDARTGTLEVVYRRPCPLSQPVVLTTWHEAREGRRIVNAAELHADGVLVAHARGVFVTVDNTSSAAAVRQMDD